MSGPGYHGRTHLPGGTDPIDFTSGLPVGVAGLNGTSQATPGTSNTLTLAFIDAYWNDDTVFGYAEVSGTTTKRAKYLTVKQSGVYQVHSMVAWGGSVIDPTTDEPFIETVVWFPSGSTEDTLINTFGNGAGSWMQEDVNPITTTQRNTDEGDYQALFSVNTVNLDLTEQGETEFGFGVAIGTANVVTRFFDPYLTVIRLGDLMVEQTIA